MNKKASSATYVEHPRRFHLFPLVSTKLRVPVEIKAPKLPTDPRSVPEHLENIRSVLNLHLSDLANDFFEVSWRTMSDWKSQDSMPEPTALEQLKALSRVADIFKREKLDRSGYLLFMKMSNGKTYAELLKAGKAEEKHLQEVMAAAKSRIEAHERMRLAHANSPESNNGLLMFVIPSFREFD